MTEHVSFKRADAAVQFVRDNAEKYGTLVGACKGLEHQRKVVHGQAFIDAHSPMSTMSNSKPRPVAEREAIAYSSPEYKAVVEDIENTWAEKTTLETLIKSAEMTFDLYRSSNKWGGP